MTGCEKSKKYWDNAKVIAWPANAIDLIKRKSEELTNRYFLLFFNLDV